MLPLCGSDMPPPARGVPLVGRWGSQQHSGSMIQKLFNSASGIAERFLTLGSRVKEKLVHLLLVDV